MLMMVAIGRVAVWRSQASGPRPRLLTGAVAPGSSRGTEVRMPALGGEQRRGGSCLCLAGRSSSHRCRGRVGAVALGRRWGQAGLEQRGGEQQRPVVAEWPGRWVLESGAGRSSSCWRRG
jgi:hypothetical protein